MVCIRKDLKVHTQERNSLNLEISDMCPVSRSRFKSFKEESEIEDGEFAVTLRKEESLNRDNCTWLSTSGASSPSSCSSDNGLSGYMDLKIDAWFISLLSTSSRSDSLLSTKVTFFDGSRVNPIDEASLVLDQRKQSDEDLVFKENLEEEGEEEVVLWLKNEASDSDSDCYSHTLDKRSKSKLAYFTDSSDEQSLFSSSSSSDYSSEVMDLEEVSTDKPLFWPLNSAPDWGSETEWDYFIMSPRKDIYKVRKSPKTTYNLCSEVSNQEPNSEKGCNRRLMFGAHLQSSDVFDLKNNEADHVTFQENRIRTPVFWPASCASEWNVDAKWDFLTISPQKDVCYRFGRSPKKCLDSYANMGKGKSCSRRLEFSRNSKSSSDNMTTKSTNVVATEEAEVDRLTTRPARKHKIVLEDLLLVEKLAAEGVIEQVLGLGEFDGHEGIQFEFNKDDFSPWF